MQMKEAREKSGLTRKAMEYYQEKGLVSPRVLENGYREYSPEDVRRLQRISLYRGLGLSLDEIRKVLGQGFDKGALAIILRGKQMESRRERLRVDLLARLAREGERPELLEEAAALLMEESFARRILHALPGYIGQVVVTAFAPYLRCPCENAEQEVAFQKLMAFLDGLSPLALPDELARYLEDSSTDISLDMLEDINQAKTEAVDDVEGWLKKNRETLKAYLDYKASPAFKESPQARLEAHLRDYFMRSGFYDRAIPLLRQISPAYDAYQEQLQKANDTLLARMPELSGGD